VQHLVFGIKAIIEMLITDMPHDIKIKMQREDYLARENLRKISEWEEERRHGIDGWVEYRK
jgi:hypothetical protein